jgi:SAM-dependent methyltransferase
VLEVGCGTGAVRVLATWPGVAEVYGVDPSPTFVAEARELGGGLADWPLRLPMEGRCPLPDRRWIPSCFIPHSAMCWNPK